MTVSDDKVIGLRHFLAGAILLVAALFLAVDRSAAQGPASVAAPASPPRPLTASDLESFMDGLFPYAMARADIVGGAVAVVKDGRLLFAKGYGYADKARKVPVDPGRTLLRPGSTSKLFTWTAVMQQVEQGRIDLDADVNIYLDFSIPRRDGRPVTMRNLMTHTPGFEEVNRDLMAASVADRMSLGTYLKRHLPKRIFPPGEIVAYSNYGTALAGYVVQRVSGERYEDYVARHILRPLGMAHSTMDQPLPPVLARLMSKGYKSASEGKSYPFELIGPAPVGSMSTTALDMARFMIAHLNQGRFGDARILAPQTVALMHSLQYRTAPGFGGFALGFWQGNRNGLRIIGHGGDSNYFHSDMNLLLDRNIGIYVSVNSSGRDGGSSAMRTAIFRNFLDRYFPYNQAADPVFQGPGSADRVAGYYLNSRRSDSGLLLMQAFSQSRVSARPDGTIEIDSLLDVNRAPKRWREIAPLVFREIGGQARVAFVADGDGRILYWTTDETPPGALRQPVHGLERQGSVMLLAPLALIVLVAALAIAIITFFARRRRGMPLGGSPREARLSLGSRLGILALLASILGWAAFFGVMGADLLGLIVGDGDMWMRLLFAISGLGLLGFLAIAANFVTVLLSKDRSRLGKIGELLVFLAASYCAWFILNYRLLDFDLKF